MTRRIAFLFLLAAISPLAVAQQIHGTVKVAFGHVRNADGTWRSIAGLELPYVAEPIQTSPLSVLPGFGVPNNGVIRPRATSTVYSADAGSGYGAIDTDDPSSLDDLVLQNGAGLPWQNLTFGVQIGVQHPFLIRWRGFNTYVTGRGPGVGAFDNEFADFGVIYPATVPNTYKITISVAAAGVVTPSDTVFFAQQFRTTQPDGEGPMDPMMKNVYNSSGPVTIGSSDNVFWYDWDPLNGLYSEDEVDNFGDTQFANLLTVITVSGAQDTLVPFAFTITKGTQLAGDITSLWYSDDDRLSIRPVPVSTPTQAPVTFTVEGVSPTATVNSLTFTIETSGTGATQVVQLFNYVTNAYDTVDTRTLTVNDGTASVTITNTPSKYVSSSNRHVKAQIKITPPPQRTLQYKVNVDRTAWVVTHP